jgi:hypothetical protein
MKLIAIVPRIPPVVDGVGDYALSLARLLRENAELTTQFVVTDSDWTGTDQAEGFEVRRLSSHSTEELLNLLERDSSANARVLLHYEGYGYATRGCPVWLVNALGRWCNESSERSLVTIFHELYASGPPWTSSFWLSSFQKNIVARLARLTDHSVTSLAFYAEKIRQFGLHDRGCVRVLPIVSNVGEPAHTPSFADRARRLVIFGTRGRRIQVYNRSVANLNRICRALGIEEVLDVGLPIEQDISKGVNVPVVVCGEVSGDEVSKLLLTSVAGVLDYPATLLAKSGIFAAYCSHRVIPVVATYGDASPADGLEANLHYWLSDVRSEQLSLAQGQAVADRALDWYQRHNLSTHAKLLAACLIGNGTAHNGRSVSSNC